MVASKMGIREGSGWHACPKRGCCIRSWRRAHTEARRCCPIARACRPRRSCPRARGTEELALFDVNARPVLAAAISRSVWRQEGRYLQDVNGFCCRRTLLRRVNIGEDRATKSLADFGQYGEPFAHAQPPRAYQTGSVRFVERALIDQIQP